MPRPAVAAFVVAAATAATFGACSSGFDTGAASLTGISPMIQSAGANSFTGSDGAGNDVLGWKLEFFSDGANQDCLSASLNELADLFIYTPQSAGSGGKATLGLSEIQIVPADPPTIVGNADVAHFVVDGASQITGTVTITTFTDKQVEGMIDAAGTSAVDGTELTITGMFNAPICE